MNSETGTDTYETPLMEKEMATHSSVLAWRMDRGAWRLQSTGSQRVDMTEVT